MINKEKKQKIVEELIENINKAQAIYFTDFSGLDVSKINELRNNLRQIETKAKVAKKNLIDVSFKKLGTHLNIREKTQNPVMIEFAFGDPILAAKTIWKFSKENEQLKILGALFNNEFLSTEKVVQLAQIPSREVLLGRLVASLASPIRNFNYVLKGNLNKLVYALKAIQNTK